MNPRAALIAFLILGNCGLLAAGSQRPPAAPVTRTAPAAKPLSEALVDAKTVFLINAATGPTTESDFRTLQAEVRRWNRFTVVDREDAADVTFSLTTTQVERPSEFGAPRGGRLVNPQTAIVRRNVSALTVRQRSSNEILWSAASESIAAVVRRLQLDLPLPTPAVCFAVWCW